MARAWRGWAGATAVALAVLTLGGCELLYFAGVKKKNDAAFKFPKGHHVLVLVDLGNGVAAPPDFPTSFADNVGRRLWLNKALDTPLISQDRLVALRQTDPAAFGRMKLGDVAQAVHADNVLYIQVTQLTTASPDGLVADGYAEVRIKVLDKDGNRVWPGDAAGQQIAARVDMELLTDRSIPQILKDLAEKLVVQIDTKFHETEDTGGHMGQENERRN